LETDYARGLTGEQAAERLEKFGHNDIEEREKVSAAKLLLGQFEDPIVLIFIASAAMSAFLGETLDFIVISAITLFIVLLGFFQEYKAEEALKKLKELSTPTAKVLRGGKLHELSIEEIVPGDVVVLATGDMVPADCELVKANNLSLDESMLTGESRPVHKDKGGEVYRGTTVVRGNAKAVVTATGAKTKFGKIAEMLEGRSRSSIQENAEELASVITKLVIGASVAIALVGLLKGASITSIVSVAIATAIAGIPEALPLTTTIVLAIGVFKMVRKNAIVRRLSAVEELGTVTVVCTDKTGTLTRNQMTVERVVAGGRAYRVTGRGYDLSGKFTHDGKSVSDPDLEKLLVSAVLCNNADLVEKGSRVEVVGDPTEIALLVAARKYGLNEDIVRSSYPRTAEVPFSSKKKFMVTHHRNGEGFKVLKGAPEVVFEKCNYARESGHHRKLTRKRLKEYRARVEEFATSGLRVIAVAVSRGRSWELLGVLGMQDPPRKGVKEAVKLANEAGIKVYMVTGDNPVTARSIGRKIGITGDVVVGADLDGMDDAELLEVLRETRILARIDPEDKLRIVKLLRGNGEIVAMTGDGVNDAPALKEADVGVSMGGRGTEVAKGASDIVLADDNFVTIINAIEMGRGIYGNIRKFTAFLLSWNIGVTAMILLSVMLFGMGEVILLPLQILLLNVVLEDLPAIALGLDPVSDSIMKDPPRDPSQPFLTRDIWTMIAGLGGYMALVSTALFLFNAVDVTVARTVAFLAFAAFVIFNALNFRSLDGSTFLTALRGNLVLLLAVAASTAISSLAIYTHAGTRVFEFAPVDAAHWAAALGFAATILVVGEVLKRSIYSRSKA
jgi:Ca2+-transporting ATPase